MPAYQENFFTRGPSPLARLTFFSLAAIVVMIADHRFQALGWLRSGVNAVLMPIEIALQWPGNALRKTSHYFSDQQSLLDENEALKRRLLELSNAGEQAKLLIEERARVESLRASANRFSTEGELAEIIRDARNPFARRIIIDKGSRANITAGRAVIDGEGVVGQVTTVGVLSSEVTLTTEKNHPVPVMVLRNGLRAVAIGAGREGTIDVPFMPTASDIQVGDRLVTSGIDGTYPAGLAVATVSIVERNPGASFARIVALPAAGADRHRLVKILATETKVDYPKVDTAPPEEAAPKAPSRGAARSRGEKR